jgi:hypothetical protein
MSPVLEVAHKQHVSSRLLKLSRQMEHERVTVGSKEDLRKDAEASLEYFQKSRTRANSVLENHSVTKSV